MNSAVAPARPAWLRLTWVVLLAAWACLLLLAPRLALPVGGALVVVAIVLSAVAMQRYGARAGLASLIAALVISPLVYFAATGPLAARLHPGDANGPADVSMIGAKPAVAPPPPQAPQAPRPEIAFRQTVTAVELSSAYAADKSGADTQYKGKRLLVAGIVDSLDPDAAGGPLVKMTAASFPAVQARGLTRDATQALKPGQQVILACNGGGMSSGAPVVDGCKIP